MTIVQQLKNASLDFPSQQKNSSNKNSSYSVLDAIKQSSFHGDGRKRNSIDPDDRKFVRNGSGVTFRTLTESLSASSEEIVETVGRTFSRFKASLADHSRRGLKDLVQDDDYEWTPPSGFNVAYSNESVHISPSKRTTRILNKISTKDREDETSTFSEQYSSQSSYSSGSWEGDMANGSLLDEKSKIASMGEYYYERDHEEEEEDDDRDEDESDNDSAFEEFREEDGLKELGEILYHGLSCNFAELAGGGTFDEDDDLSTTTDVRDKRQKSKSSTPTVSQNLSFFRKMFSCGG